MGIVKHVEEKKGEIYILIKIIFEGFVPVGAHFGATHMPPIEFLAIITLISSLFFVGTTFYYKEFRQLFTIKNLGPLFMYTLTVAVVPYGIIMYATKYTNAIDTSLLLQSEIIYAAIIGLIILKEKMSVNKVIGILAIIGANIVILYKGGIEFNLPNIAIATAPFIFVFGNIIAKRLQRDGMGWSPLLLFRQLIGGIILLAVSCIFENPINPSPNLWFFIIAFGITAFGVSKMFWQLALHRLDVSKVTALLATTPIISTAIAYLWLNEIPSRTQWIGVTLTIIGAAFLLNTTSKQWEQQKE